MKQILLVDDDEDDRDFFMSVLQQIDNSFNCQTAENGSMALDGLTAGRYSPELIFLDLNMPIMNGKQFLHEVRKHERLKDIPIIILSTSSDQSTISEMVKLGAADFVTKPNKLSLLETRLRQIFASPDYQ